MAPPKFPKLLALNISSAPHFIFSQPLVFAAIRKIVISKGTVASDHEDLL
jgi:hypothetical protein